MLRACPSLDRRARDFRTERARVHAEAQRIVAVVAEIAALDEAAAEAGLGEDAEDEAEDMADGGAAAQAAEQLRVYRASVARLEQVI